MAAMSILLRNVLLAGQLVLQAGRLQKINEWRCGGGVRLYDDGVEGGRGGGAL